MCCHRWSDVDKIVSSIRIYDGENPFKMVTHTCAHMHNQNGESDRPFSTQLIRITLSLNENLGAIVMVRNRCACTFACTAVCMRCGALRCVHLLQTNWIMFYLLCLVGKLWPAITPKIVMSTGRCRPEWMYWTRARIIKPTHIILHSMPFWVLNWWQISRPTTPPSTANAHNVVLHIGCCTVHIHEYINRKIFLV